MGRIEYETFNLRVDIGLKLEFKSLEELENRFQGYGSLENLPYNKLRLEVMDKLNLSEEDTLAPGALILYVEDAKKLKRHVEAWYKANYPKNENTNSISSEVNAINTIYGPNVTTDPKIRGNVLVDPKGVMPKPACSKGCNGCGS